MEELFKKVNCNFCGFKDHTPLFRIERFNLAFNIVKCPKCNLVYMNPMLTEEALQSFYNENYYSKKTNYVYFDERKFENIVVKAGQNRAKFIDKMVNLEKGRLLDVGCAFGLFLKSVKQVYKQCEIYGVDISEYSAAYAREKLGLNVFTGILREAKYPNEYFDVVVMSEIIEHLRHPLEEMKEVNRILNVGGIVVIQTCDIESIEAKIKGKKYTYFVPGHVHYFSRKTTKKLLEKSGFRIERMLHTDLGFYTYALLKMAKKGLYSKLVLFKYIVYNIIGNIYLGNTAVAGRMVCYARKIN